MLPALRNVLKHDLKICVVFSKFIEIIIFWQQNWLGTKNKSLWFTEILLTSYNSSLVKQGITKEFYLNIAWSQV